MFDINCYQGQVKAKSSNKKKIECDSKKKIEKIWKLANNKWNVIDKYVQR